MTEEAKSGEGEPGTKEAEALASALNRSAERVQTLWFSFLTFILYLAIATGTTTHRMLFLESPLNLPVLNVPLPLLGFYILTPITFVVFHFYMLLNLVLLARTAKSFEDGVTHAFPDDNDARENFRMRIENTLFVQLLVGGRLEREGINAKLLSLMALITLALAPVALLLMFQIKFLPYHSEWITWLHRSLLALDLTLVWTLWPGYRSGWGERLWPKRSWRLAVPGVLSAVALVYAAVVATFPDERIYVATNWLHGSTYFDPSSDIVQFRDRPNWYVLIAPINTLDLHGEDLIDDAKLAHIIEKNEAKNESSTGAQRWAATLFLAGGDLTGANLSSADVSHVDFSFAILNRADLRFALAKRAHFDSAHLQGARLDGAELQAASLDHAQLQGASLDGAQLQAASLDHAQLQGASLDGAQLQGASFRVAPSLFLAFGRAELQGASFVQVYAWRADTRQAAWKDTWVERPETGSKADNMHECDWTVDSLAELKQLIAKEVPEGVYKRAALKRILQRLDPTKALEGEEEMGKVWDAREREALTPEAYRKSLAGQWREVGCAAEGAPFVLHALIYRLSIPLISPFRDQGDAAKALAAAFLDEAHCPGALGLSEAGIAKLKEIAGPAAPQAPKP